MSSEIEIIRPLFKQHNIEDALYLIRSYLLPTDTYYIEYELTNIEDSFFSDRVFLFIRHKPNFMTLYEREYHTNQIINYISSNNLHNNLLKSKYIFKHLIKHKKSRFLGVIRSNPNRNPIYLNPSTIMYKSIDIDLYDDSIHLNPDMNMVV